MHSCDLDVNPHAVQAMQTWRVWITCVAREAPSLLARLVAQTTVELMEYLDADGSPEQALAVAILEDLVIKNKPYTQSAVKNMPTLPGSKPGGCCRPPAMRPRPLSHTYAQQTG